jgi:periplasmic divalent cation tolerance protein
MHLSVLYTTFPSVHEADQIARSALEKKLAACVNILPAGQSIYLWEGTIETPTETYTIFKTTPDLLPQLQQFIEQNHPYDTPAILTWNTLSSNNYATYIQKTLSTP